MTASTFTPKLNEQSEAQKSVKPDVYRYPGLNDEMLFYAIKTNPDDLETIKRYLDEGANPNVGYLDSSSAVSQKYHTTVHLAASTGSVELVELLLKYEALLNLHLQFTKEITDSALDIAIMRGHAYLVKFLIDNNAKHSISSLESTYFQNRKNVLLKTIGFHILLRSPDWKVRCLIIEDTLNNPSLINLNLANSNGYTPLQQAAIDDNDELISFLLKHNADITATTNTCDSSPLRLAILNGKTSAVTTLLDHNASLFCFTKQDGNSHTALQDAVTVNNRDIINLLLQRKLIKPQEVITYAKRIGSADLAKYVKKHYVFDTTASPGTVATIKAAAMAAAETKCIKGPKNPQQHFGIFSRGAADEFNNSSNSSKSDLRKPEPS